MRVVLAGLPLRGRANCPNQRARRNVVLSLQRIAKAQIVLVAQTPVCALRAQPIVQGRASESSSYRAGRKVAHANQRCTVLIPIFKRAKEPGAIFLYRPTKRE